MVQWLGLGAFTAMPQVRPLVGDLRSRKPHGTDQKEKTDYNLSNHDKCKPEEHDR